MGLSNIFSLFHHLQEDVFAYGFVDYLVLGG